MGLKAYIANQFGFSKTGEFLLEELIKPGLLKIGVTALDPFEACGLEIDFKRLETLEKHEDIVAFWDEFNQKVTPINNKLIRDSDCLLAILDGGPAVDDGVASEIGYYAASGLGPIFALRTDFRCGENLAASINPQVYGYIKMTGGKLVDRASAGEKVIDLWFEEIKLWVEKVGAELNAIQEAFGDNRI